MSNKFMRAAICAVVLASTSAQAGNRTYLSRFGSDANACTDPLAPCVTFSKAIAVAATDGEVRCLDSGFFGTINITFSVAIMCEGNIGQTGFNFNTISLPVNNVAVLNGIDIDMRNNSGPALAISGAGTVLIHNSSIRKVSGNGLSIVPTGALKMVINNTILEGNTNLGMVVAPTGTGAANIEIDGLTVGAGASGIATVAATGTTVVMDIRNSKIAHGTAYDVIGSTTGGVSVIYMENSVVSDSPLGVFSVGANSYVLVANSAIVGNNLGWGFSSGGALYSFGNNVFNNAAGGTASGTIPLQ